MKKMIEKNLRLLLVVLLMSNVLCFVATAQPEKVKYYLGRNEVFEKLPNTENEIIMVGNSLTHHFEWHEMFRDVNIINRGIGGDITQGVSQRLNEILESKPLKIFIEIGINDIARGFPIDSIYGNYEKIIQTIKERCPQTKIYIESVLPAKEEWNNLALELNQRIKEYGLQNGVPYIDLYSKFVMGNKLNPKYDCGDGVHLSGDGYLLWCSCIKEYVYE